MGAQGQMDLSKYLGHDALKLENLIPLVVRKINGKMKMEKILQKTPSEDTFTWFEQIDTSKFDDIRKRAEGAAPGLSVIEYEKHTGSCYRYAEAGDVSEDRLRFGYEGVSAITDVTEAVTEKLALRVERDILAELQDTTAHSTIGIKNASDWSTASTATPVDDFVDAEEEISFDESQGADLVIMGSKDYNYLIRTDQVMQSRMYTTDVTDKDLYVASLAGVPIIVHRGIYYSSGTRTRLLDTQAIMLNKKAAKLFEAISVDVSRKIKDDVVPPVIRILISRMLTSKVVKPQLICLLQSTQS